MFPGFTGARTSGWVGRMRCSAPTAPPARAKTSSVDPATRVNERIMGLKPPPDGSPGARYSVRHAASPFAFRQYAAPTDPHRSSPGTTTVPPSSRQSLAFKYTTVPPPVTGFATTLPPTVGAITAPPVIGFL